MIKIWNRRNFIKFSLASISTLSTVKILSKPTNNSYDISGNVSIPSGEVPEGLEARLLDLNDDILAIASVENGQFNFKNTAINDIIKMPLDYKLSHNYPNPFNPSTSLAFEMKKQGNVKVEIFNVLGKLLDKFDNNFGSGNYTINWNPNACAAGKYLAKVTLGNLVFTEKMTLIDGSGYGRGISIHSGGQNIPDDKSIKPLGLRKAMNEDLRLQIVSTDGKYYNRTEKDTFNYNGSQVDAGVLKTFETHTVPGTSVFWIIVMLLRELCQGSWEVILLRFFLMKQMLLPKNILMN